MENMWPGLITMIASMVSVSILVLVISYYVYFPVKEYSRKRKEHITKKLETSAKLEADANAIYVKAKTAKVESVKKAQEIVTNATQAASLEKERILNEARQESAHLISHAEEVSREKIEGIKTQAQKEITELALKAAEKVIGKNVNSEVNEKLIDDFISELKTK